MVGVVVRISPRTHAVSATDGLGRRWAEHCLLVRLEVWRAVRGCVMDRQLVSCIRGGLGRQTGLGFVAAAVLALVLPASGLVTFSGRNGVLLLSSSAYLPPFVTRAPLARLADCTMNPAWRLWTVRPAGSHHTDLGPGDSGLFSPGGGRLAVTSSGDPCSFASPERQGPGLYLGSAAGSDLQSIKGDKLVGWLPTGAAGRRRASQVSKDGIGGGREATPVRPRERASGHVIEQLQPLAQFAVDLVHRSGRRRADLALWG